MGRGGSLGQALFAVCGVARSAPCGTADGLRGAASDDKLSGAKRPQEIADFEEPGLYFMPKAGMGFGEKPNRKCALSILL